MSVSTKSLCISLVSNVWSTISRFASQGIVDCEGFTSYYISRIFSGITWCHTMPDWIIAPRSHSKWSLPEMVFLFYGGRMHGAERLGRNKSISLDQRQRCNKYQLLSSIRQGCRIILKHMALIALSAT